MSKNPIKLKQRSGYHPRERERLLDALDEMLQDDPEFGERVASLGDSEEPVGGRLGEREPTGVQQENPVCDDSPNEKEKEAKKRERHVPEAQIVPW